MPNSSNSRRQGIARLTNVMRAAEWVFTVYFVYVAILTALFALPPHSEQIAWTIAVVIPALVLILAKLKWEFIRDWFALAATLTAYREMNLFSPERHQHRLEHIWIVWDRVLLHQAGFQRAVEALGPVVPSILE